MIFKRFFYALFPVAGNASCNKKLKKKILDSDKQNGDKLDTPLSKADNPSDVSDESLKAQYESSLKTKDKLEDKAKVTIVSVTLSVSLIMGASGLLSTLSSRFDYPVIRWISYILFLYSVLSMIVAAVMDIKVLSDENIVYLVPIDCPQASLRETYNTYTGKNWAQNLIRNNYVFSAYESVRNALICLFLIMALAVIPIHSLSSGDISITNQNTARAFSFDETTLGVLDNQDLEEIKSTVESALLSMQTTDGEFYSITDSSHTLFIRFQIIGNDINIVTIEEIDWAP